MRAIKDNLMRYFIVLLFCVTLISATCNGQKLEHFYDTSRIPLDPSVKIGKLQNGFTYYIIKPDSTDGFIRMRLLVKAGSNVEDEHQLEFAHLVEHMAFEGTLHFPLDSLRRYAAKQGLDGGLSIGAMTGPKSTTYQIDIPEQNFDSFNNSLLILRDWTQDVLFTPHRIQAQIGAVIGEHRTNGDRVSARVTFDKNQKIIDNNYGSIFFENAINNLKVTKPESLLQFYEEWYRPDLEAIIIVGNVDVEDLERRINAIFSNLRGPVHRLGSGFLFNRQEGKLQNKRRLIKIRDNEKSDIDLEFYYKRLSDRSNLKTVYDYRLVVIDNICNYLLWRWTQNLEKRGFARNVRAGIHRHFDNSNIDVLTIQASLNSEEEIENSYRVIVSELEVLRTRGFDNEFLSAAKINFLDLQRRYLNDQATILDKCAAHFVSGDALCSFDYELSLSEHLLSGITLKDINCEIFKWLGIENDRDVVIAGGDECNFPGEEDVGRWEMENRRKPLANLKSGKVMLTSRKFMKAAKFPIFSEQILYKESYFIDTSIVLLEFNNGSKVVLCPTGESFGNDKDEIVLTAFKPFVGDNDSLNTLYKTLYSDIFSSVGLGGLSRDELNQFQKDMHIYVDCFTDDSSSRIVASSHLGKFESMLQSIYLYFMPPKMNLDEFARWKSNKKYETRRIYNDPEVYFENQVRSVTRNERLLTIEDVDRIELDTVLRFYSNQFSGVGDFVFFLLRGTFPLLKMLKR